MNSRSKNVKNKRALVLSQLAFVCFLSACSSTPSKDEDAVKAQQPPKIKVPATELTGGVPGSVIEKPLITIILSPNKILINNKLAKGLPEVKKELAKFYRPAIAIQAHKCVDAKLATEVMNLAQDHTDTPIPFGSFGRFDDKGC